MNQEKYGLDLHCNMLLDEYNENMPAYEKIMEIAQRELDKAIKGIGLYIVAHESRIKAKPALPASSTSKATSTAPSPTSPTSWAYA